MGVSSSPYAVLGVGTGASGEEIAKAYRRKARLLHPDMGGSSEGFQEVQEAYQVLVGKLPASKSRWATTSTGYRLSRRSPLNIRHNGGIFDIIVER